MARYRDSESEKVVEGFGGMNKGLMIFIIVLVVAGIGYMALKAL